MATRANLENLAMAFAAGLKVSEISGGKPTIDLMVQKAADETAYLTCALITDSKFNAVADQQKYSLNTVVSRFCVIGPPGLYWNQGTADTPDYKQLIPVSIKWLDENIANWRDADSDAPQYFAQEGSDLVIHPKPSASLANAFWLYFGQKAYNMADDTNYPFYGTSEYEHLTVLDMAIVLHFRWQAQFILNKGEAEILGARKDYDNEIERVTGLLMRNLAIQNSRYNKYGGPAVR
jgi:hypothetical protein